MKRRNFLKTLGIGIAAAMTVRTVIDAFVPEEPVYMDNIVTIGNVEEVHDHMLDAIRYSGYRNFNGITIRESGKDY